MTARNYTTDDLRRMLEAFTVTTPMTLETKKYTPAPGASREEVLLGNILIDGNTTILDQDGAGTVGECTFRADAEIFVAAPDLARLLIEERDAHTETRRERDEAIKEAWGSLGRPMTRDEREARDRHLNRSLESMLSDNADETIRGLLRSAQATAEIEADRRKRVEAELAETRARLAAMTAEETPND